MAQGPDADSWRCWFALSHVDTVSREPHMQVMSAQHLPILPPSRLLIPLSLLLLVFRSFLLPPI